MSAYSDLLLSTSPVAYWRLGESVGTTAVDSSGNGHNGTYTNGPTLGQPGLIVDTDTAVSFDGDNDHVAVPQHPALQIAGALTVQAWIRQDAAKTTRVVYEGDTDGTVIRHYNLAVRADGSVVFAWFNALSQPVALSSPPGLISPGETYHVVATRTAALFARIYVDGVEVAAQQLAGAPVGTPTHFRIGSFGEVSQFFNGLIDEVAVHNVALTGPQVAGLYELGANGPPPPPPPPSGGGVTRPARRYHRMGRGVTR